MCFGREKSAAEIRAIAQENFRRIGENYLSAVKTAAMSYEALRPHIEFTGLENLPKTIAGQTPAQCRRGHRPFRQLRALRAASATGPSAKRFATTYRALKQPALNRLMQDLRGHSRCRFFERRAEGRALRALMAGGGVTLGLLADQSSPGLRAPFLGHDCNTGLAPAIFALRYDAELSTAICYRVAPGEMAAWNSAGQIPTHENGQPRPAGEIMRDVNRAFETAVRRDPANWFWVHRRWKD